jgi:hypothetical protein
MPTCGPTTGSACLNPPCAIIASGAPYLKDRLFFFFNYEGRRLPGGAQATRIVPTESFRRGILRFRNASGNIFTVDPRTFDPRRLGANPADTELFEPDAAAK